MFVRHAIRSTGPIRSQFRQYATNDKPASAGGTLGYVAVAAGLGIGGYYYYANVLHKAPPVPISQGQTSPSKAFVGGDQGFVSLKLEKVEKINHNTSKFIFALEPNQTSGLSVASALITKFKGSSDEKPTIRPYTPVSDEDAVGHIDFIIKKYPNGPMSEYIHSMTPGQELEIKGPIPKLPITPNKYEHIAMIAGGTGITPMWQVARAIFKNPEDKTKVTLVYGNISEEDILLKKELRELENTYPQRFRAFYLLDNPPEGWSGGKGYVTKDLLKTVLPEPKEKNILVAVCGPPGLCKVVSGPKKSPQDQGDLTGHLKELGYEKDQVFKF